MFLTLSSKHTKRTHSYQSQKNKKQSLTSSAAAGGGGTATTVRYFTSNNVSKRLIINAVGSDRLGIVSDMTKYVTDSGGNVGESVSLSVSPCF